MKLTRFEIKYIDEFGDVYSDGIFNSNVTDKNRVKGNKCRKLVKQVYAELKSPDKYVRNHGNAVIFFFKEEAFEQWKLNSFAKILVNNFDPFFAETVELVTVDFEIVDQNNSIVYEDEFQVAIDLKYYMKANKKNLYPHRTKVFLFVTNYLKIKTFLLSVENACTRISYVLYLLQKDKPSATRTGGNTYDEHENQKRSEVLQSWRQN